MNSRWLKMIKESNYKEDIMKALLVYTDEAHANANYLKSVKQRLNA